MKFLRPWTLSFKIYRIVFRNSRWPCPVWRLKAKFFLLFLIFRIGAIFLNNFPYIYPMYVYRDFWGRWSGIRNQIFLIQDDGSNMAAKNYWNILIFLKFTMHLHKGYFHSMMAIHIFRTGFVRDRQKRALVGRSGGDGLLLRRGGRFFSATAAAAVFDALASVGFSSSFPPVSPGFPLSGPLSSFDVFPPVPLATILAGPTKSPSLAFVLIGFARINLLRPFSDLRTYPSLLFYRIFVISCLSRFARTPTTQPGQLWTANRFIP